ncbi:MAG TPA: glutamine amidotransferase [Polyangiales bacterium]
MNARVVTDWQIGWGVPGGLPVAVAFGIALAVLAILGSRLGPMPLSRRLGLLSLRWLSALAAFVLGTQPTLWAERKRAEPGQLAVLLDVSRSMGIDTDGTSRAQRMVAAVRKLGNAPHVRWYAIGEALTPIEPDKVPSPLASGSALIPRLSELARSEDLGAVLLFSDGADTSGQAVPSTLSTRVHTVFVPDGRALRDDAIAEVHADAVAFLHGEAMLHATLTSTGLGDRDLEVTLERAGRTLATRMVHVPQGGSQSLEIGFAPEALGREAYTLKVTVDGEDDVPENNERPFLVRVVRDRLRVLHVSGRPSWDQRFLRGFLKRDPSIDLISFYILRSVHDLTMSDPTELALIPFPTDELFRQHLTSFDLIVLQDFDYAPYQMAPYLLLIRDYVRQGGGLAMVGGSLSFDGGGYAETALAEVLPVKLRPTRPDGAVVVEGAFSPEPVAALLHHPLLELYPDAAQTLTAFRALEPLLGANDLLGVREGGLALLEHPRARVASGERMPVLSVGSYGTGRVLAFGTDTSWHWSMPTAGRGGDPSAYDRFWDRAIRWLTRDPLLEPSSLASDRESYGPGGQIAVSGLARDPTYRPVRHGELRLSLLTDRDIPLITENVRSDDAGRFSASLPAPDRPGVYKLALTRDRTELARTALLVELSGVELAKPAPNAKLLEQLSKVTGGRFIASPDDIPGLEAFDATRSTALGIERHAPFGEPPWAALLFAVIALEWIVRRRLGQS